MSRGLLLTLIVLAALAASLWFSSGSSKESFIEAIQKGIGSYSTASSGGKNIPAEFQSGKSRFSQGACAKDADCQVGGCSGEVCSSSGDIVSTCEYSDSFPSKEKYSCTCLPAGRAAEGVCGWK